MVRFIDLSHDFADGMPGFTVTLPDGSRLCCTARIRPLITHAQSRGTFDDKAEFELTEASFPTSIGTYIDSPYVRHRDRCDVGALRIEELILPGIVIDLGHLAAGAAAEIADLRRAMGDAFDVAGKAVLCRFGWDRLWGQDAYFATYPFLSRAAIRALIDGECDSSASIPGMSTTTEKLSGRPIVGYWRATSSSSRICAISPPSAPGRSDSSPYRSRRGAPPRCRSAPSQR
jgi:kynurenine formamidase